MKKRSWSKVAKNFSPLWRAKIRIPAPRPQDVHSGTKKFFPSLFFVPLWRSCFRGRLLFFVYLSHFWIFFGHVRGKDGQLDELSNCTIECFSRSCLVGEVHCTKTENFRIFFCLIPIVPLKLSEILKKSRWPKLLILLRLTLFALASPINSRSWKR